MGDILILISVVIVIVLIIIFWHPILIVLKFLLISAAIIGAIYGVIYVIRGIVDRKARAKQKEAEREARKQKEAEREAQKETERKAEIKRQKQEKKQQRIAEETQRRENAREEIKKSLEELSQYTLVFSNAVNSDSKKDFISINNLFDATEQEIRNLSKNRQYLAQDDFSVAKNKIEIFNISLQKFFQSEECNDELKMRGQQLQKSFEEYFPSTIPAQT